MSQFPFVGGSYQSRSLNFDAQRCVNMYPEISESGTSAFAGILIGTPGLRRVTTVGTGPIRALFHPTADALLVVSGSELYRLDTSFNATLIGSVGGSGLASMASNGQQVMIVTGSGTGYFLNLKTWALSAADSAVFTGADRVAFLDGRFVWNMPGTGKFMWTDLYSTSVNALNFATAEGSPDNLVSLIVDHRELWLFGESTTEVWFSSGSSDLPMSRIEGAFIEHGCAAPQSVAKLDNTVFWLGADENGHGMVWRANGYNPARISTHAVEFAIGGYSRIDDAQAFTYQQEGHSFYVLTFPTANATWVYDVAAQVWHERAWRSGDGQLNRIRSNCHVAFAGMNLAGDFEDGRLYAVELDHYTDDGDLIPRIRTCAHILNDGQQITVSALRIDFETGVGLISGQGYDPQAMLEVSKDGGHTWGNQRWVPLGRVGERRARAIWRRLGQSRDWVFRVTVTDPVPVRIISASLEVS